VTRVDLHKLLGGYAAGTLTEEERRALFEAALTDQPLFDALADEEALREVLADPACRERVRSALADRPPTACEAFGAWLRRPSVWALAGAMAAAVVLTVVVFRTKPVRQSPAAGKQIALATHPVPSIVNAPASSRPATPPRSRLETRRFVPPPPVARHQAPSSAPREMEAPPAAQPATLAGRLRSPEPHGGGFGSLGDFSGAAAPPPPPPPSAQAAPARTKQLVVGAPATKSVEVQAESHLPVTGRNVAGLEKAKKFAPLGLRYTLLRRGAEDKDTEVPPDTPFSRGESARLRIDADRAGYLYVLAGKDTLFSGPIAAGQPVVVETEPGVLHLLLLPEADSGPLSTLVSRTRNRADRAAVIVDVPIQSR
jgi:hypothetical protein